MNRSVDEGLHWAVVGAPSAAWVQIFTFGCYAMFLACFFHAVSDGAHPDKRRVRANVTALLAFVFAYWFVESWAHHRTPYYSYATGFVDLLPRLPIGSLGVPSGPSNACTSMVLGLDESMRANGIPLSVLVMEASLSYAALWTVRGLCRSQLIQPLLAALMLVNVDALLDPVVASAHNCASGAPLVAGAARLGLWRWYTDPALSADWFGIPLFNYAAWFAAPALLVSLTNLLAPIDRDRQAPRRLLIVLVLGIGAFMFFMTPGKLPPHLQGVAFLGVLALAVGAVWRKSDAFRFSGRWQPLTAVPSLSTLGLASAALVSTGLFVRQPLLLPVWGATVLLGIWFIFLPHRSERKWLLSKWQDCERLIRVHYVGFTVMLALLGGGAVAGAPSAGLIAGLLTVALSFHVYAYVLNDVIDLEVDRLQPRRQRDPLVRGAISRHTALAIALVQLPISCLATIQLHGDTRAWLALAAAYLLMFVYNRWGKVCAVPPVTDVVQGLGWGALALYGMFIAKPELTSEDFERVAPIFVYGTGFIVLINGIHGGLRDLWSDGELKKRTTAIFLGAKRRPGSPDQEVFSGWPLTLFAFAVHTAMFVPVVTFLLRQPSFYLPELRGPVGELLAFLFALSNVVLWRVVRPIEPARSIWVSRHLFVLLLPPLVLYALSQVTSTIVSIAVLFAYFVPLFAQEQLRDRALGIGRRLLNVEEEAR
jgi:4-hydroxybenzoate polyprenyltransferase